MLKGHEKEPSKTSQGQSNESPAPIKDVSTFIAILDSVSIRTNPFGSNVSGDTAYRRVERICAALHLLTNHVHESEPLRVNVRNGSIRLLSAILELRASFRTSDSEQQQIALAGIRELISLTRLLAIAGFASAQNAQAVSDALDELGSLIVVSQRSILSEQITLEHKDFMPPPSKTFSQSIHGVHDAEEGVKKTVRPRLKRIRTVNPENGSSARADHIMDILKLGGFFGIKDIAANLPQYSEKMVQRELAELVRLGKITKTGSKRWSRYQIAQ